MKRRATKLVGNSSWFKRLPNKENNQTETQKSQNRNRKPINTDVPKKIESILFCPFTPFPELRNKLQEEEDKINGQRATCRVKVIERAGPKIGEILGNKTPWIKESCGRPNCKPCQTKPGKCKAPGVIYKIQCEECKSQNKTTLYIGESKRTFFDRALHHNKALMNKNTNTA